MDFEMIASMPMDRGDLTAFIEGLADSISSSPAQWENVSLEQFLRAWAAWLEDMDGYFANHGETAPVDPSWRFIAQMLLAARQYE